MSVIPIQSGRSGACKAEIFKNQSIQKNKK